MARNFPADTKLQHFYEEQFAKEDVTRLQFYFDNKDSKNKSMRPRDRAAVRSGLPTINPTEFAVRKKREEDEMMRQIVEQARQSQSKEEMWSPDSQIKSRLYDGISREEKGRYQYLRERHDTIPERKFAFPLCSSWDYGWKVGDEMGQYQRPKYARTAKVKESFYTCNGIPTLTDPKSNSVS